MTAVTARLAGLDGLVARLAADLAARIAALTTEVNTLEKEIAALTGALAASLLALPGAGDLTAAKIVAETVGASEPGPRTYQHEDLHASLTALEDALASPRQERLAAYD